MCTEVFVSQPYANPTNSFVFVLVSTDCEGGCDFSAFALPLPDAQKTKGAKR